MKNSSNSNMKHVFHHLESIKPVEPNANLQARTWVKIQKQYQVPKIWVRVAACFFVALMGTEFYLTFNKIKTSNKDISLVIYKPNNMLYHE